MIDLIKLKNKIKYYITFFRRKFYKKSYSQEGEDMLLSRIFEKQETGFYVDVGAHHPMRFSNTYYFYKLGWRGINIDAMPGSMKLFEKYRTYDINLEIPISSHAEILTYYMFDELALNTFDTDIVSYHKSKGKVITSKKMLKTKTLSEILDSYLPNNKKIDFMNIDVEGFDYKVLTSNDWSRYKPHIILVEDRNQQSLRTIENSKIVLFLKNKGYFLYAKLVYTLVFMYQN